MISPTLAGGKENELLLDEDEAPRPTSRIASSRNDVPQKMQSRLLNPSRVAGIPRPSSIASPARPSSMVTSRSQPAPAERELGDDDYVQVEGSDAPPPTHTRPAVSTSSGRPVSGISRGIPRSGTGTSSSAARNMGAGTTAPAGQESWRRAAEVTQNLKARIELMKVS